MHRIFLPVYNFFKGHKALMYVLMIASTLVFAWFGFKIRLEEDIVKLLPRSSTDNELAFSEIELKDKVFIQVTSRNPENPVEASALGNAVEEFCGILEKKDSSTHYIAGILSSLDTEMAMDAMDFGLTHLPTLVDVRWYDEIEKRLGKEAIDAQMEENYRLVMADETGTDTQLAAMDPLGLREIVMENILGKDGSIGGFTLEDGHLFCPDKTVALAFISPSFDPMDSGMAGRMVKMIRKTQKEYEQAHPDIRLYIHGNPQGSVSNASTIKNDVFWTVGLSLLVILVIILLSFHSLTFVWQQVLPIVYGTVFSLACIYWIKGYMSLMALGLGAIVLGVAISYCLHVLIHFYYVGDAEKMLKDESTPVFLGCITTVGAFMGLLFTESDLLRDFGLFATFALLGNTFFALVFLPHFLRKEQIKFKREHGFPLVERINNLPWDRKSWFILGLVAVIVVGIVFSPRVKFDNDLRNLDYDNPELTESQNLYNEKNADGFAHMYFAAWSEDNLDEALTYNDNLYQSLESLKESGLVKGFVPVTHMLFRPEKNQVERIQAWKAFWTPERIEKLRPVLNRSAIEHNLQPYLFEPFFSLVEADYEPGDLYASGIVPAGLLSNYIEQQESGRFMVFTDVSYELEDQDAVWDAVTANPNVIVLEPFYYCRDMVEIVHDDFSTTLWISSLFVLIVLLISFRNLWISLIAFFPMFISWYVMQGFMAISGLEFNLINIVISTFIYGIGVDYSIFVMEGLLKEARDGEKKTLEYHKVAIFFSALVLVIVVSSLIFATHPAIHSIGLITLIGMASTILITYSLEPFVFRKLCKIPFFRRSFRIKD
ncbi:MAG: MMPL family transporter [Bacteroidales bacterium]|nr:MMPL family transporter [Bacteroidales bacterium]